MSTALVVPPKGLVERAFDLALPVPAVDEGVREEMNALMAARRTLLPVEAGASVRLSGKIEELASTLRRSKFTEPMLPMEPLGWRWKNGLPKLVLLAIGENPIFEIHAKRSRFSVSHVGPRHLPGELRRQYADVARMAESHCVRRDSERTYTFTFDGVIPMETRTKIGDALALRRFEGIFLLVEAPETAWETKSVKGMSRSQAAREWMAENADPLVLGWASESLWVIDKFDLTSLETYVLDEFSQKALPAGS